MGARRVEKGLEVERVGMGVLFREVSSGHLRERSTVRTDSTLNADHLCISEFSEKGFCPRLQTSYITIPKLQTSLAIEYFL